MTLPRRLKLLFLLPFPPRLDGWHGGSRVTAQLIAGLARRHDTAVCYLRSGQEPAIDPRLAEQCRRVEEVCLPGTETVTGRRWLETARVWRDVLTGKPRWASGRFSPAFIERVRDLLRTWSPDLIQFEFHIMGQYLPACAGYPAPRVLVQHEPGEATAREAARGVGRYHGGTGRLMPLLDALAWRRFEREVMRQMQAVVVFTERDRAALSRAGRLAPIVRIAPGTPLPEAPLSPLGTHPPGLLFFGSFLHPPNVDAAERLIHSIFPRVLERCPEARLYIVGAEPPPQIQACASAQVTVTGYVPDLTPYLDQAALVVAPLRLGGGLRVKVLEALAAGKALVASPLAVEGLDLLDGRQVVLAEEDQAFSDAVLQLLADPDRRAGLAAGARAWACAHAGWDTAVAAYESLYQALLEIRA
jgi:glycosyltransferase involved in cell wall biosynthesis